MIPMDDAGALDRALALIARRVEEHRKAGLYPPGLEEQFRDELDALLGGPGASPSRRVEEALEAYRRLPALDPAAIPTTSSLPGGSALHATVARVVSRQVGGLAQQLRSQFAAVDEVLVALVDLVRRLEVASLLPGPRPVDGASVLDRLAAVDELAATLRQLDARLERLERRLDALAADG